MADDSQLRASEITGVLLAEIENYEEELHAEEKRFREAKRAVEYLVEQALYGLKRERELYP